MNFQGYQSPSAVKQIGAKLSLQNTLLLLRNEEFKMHILYACINQKHWPHLKKEEVQLVTVLATFVKIYLNTVF